MNCDQVFMILTRGPFPTGEPWDEEVEDHLETCAACWQLAEALRPALDVFQEAVPAAESRNLPGYWGDARPAAVTIAKFKRAAAHQRTSGAVLASGVRRAARPARISESDTLSDTLAVEMLRVAVLASTLTAAAIGLVLLWRG